jgi:hypothetical protein
VNTTITGRLGPAAGTAAAPLEAAAADTDPKASAEAARTLPHTPDIVFKRLMSLSITRSRVSHGAAIIVAAACR